MKITILTDSSSWMNDYNEKLVESLKQMGHEVKLIHSKNELTAGDIAFFLSCFEIISQEYLKLNAHNIVVHESDLPQGKGWSPMSWQILEGKNNIPITLFDANESADSGDFYLKNTVCLDGTELIDEWQKKLGDKICEMCVKFISEHDSLAPQKQSGESSFYRRRTPQDSELDSQKSIESQFNLLRIADNERYPVFFIHKNKKYAIKIFLEK